MKTRKRKAGSTPEVNPAGTKLSRKAFYGQLAVCHPRGLKLNGIAGGTMKVK
jgi:hypothetical protein